MGVRAGVLLSFHLSIPGDPKPFVTSLAIYIVCIGNENVAPRCALSLILTIYLSMGLPPVCWYQHKGHSLAKPVLHILKGEKKAIL